MRSSTEKRRTDEGGRRDTGGEKGRSGSGRGATAAAPPSTLWREWGRQGARSLGTDGIGNTGKETEAGGTDVGE